MLSFLITIMVMVVLWVAISASSDKDKSSVRGGVHTKRKQKKEESIIDICKKYHIPPY